VIFASRFFRFMPSRAEAGIIGDFNPPVAAMLVEAGMVV